MFTTQLVQTQRPKAHSHNSMFEHAIWDNPKKIQFERKRVQNNECSQLDPSEEVRLGPKGLHDPSFRSCPGRNVKADFPTVAGSRALLNGRRSHAGHRSRHLL